MKGSDLFVSALENEGVERIFSVPGEENLDVVERCSARCRDHSAVDENSAADCQPSDNPYDRA